MIDELLRACSVRIVTAGSSGTGAFVAPGLVLTCAHVIASAHKTAGPLRVFWSGRELDDGIEIVDYHAGPFPDLALLRVPLGGRAVPVSAVFAAMASIAEEQRLHHAADSRWHACLDPVQRARLQRRSDAAANPFLGESEEVIGRDEALHRVFDKLRAGNHCSVVGPRGSGKSALLRLLRPRLGEQLDWTASEVAWLNFRTIETLRELQEALVHRLGGQRAGDWRSLMRVKPLRLVVLDDLGGMDAGAKGLEMRRWLRGLHDQFQTRLLPLSNERLEVLFRKDDPLRDSPLAGIDPIPVVLGPLPAADCRRLVEARLAGSKLPFADYAGLCREPQQPAALLARCAARFEEQRRIGQRSAPA
ncbi:S1 family peptidase [Candidatus Accumulibacter aalborgensis]|nr:serine protease [Candidatus Accumulibacter aalborgensis]